MRKKKERISMSILTYHRNKLIQAFWNKTKTIVSAMTMIKIMVMKMMLMTIMAI